MSGVEKSFYSTYLERWGTEGLTETEVLDIKRIFGDRAQALLDYYSN